MVARLPHRVTDIQLKEGAELVPLVADDFVLVPNPRECNPSQKYVVVFQAKPL
jgi:zinc protease